MWGKDAATFNPARWFKENGEPISFSPFSQSHVIMFPRRIENTNLRLLTARTTEYHSWNAGPRSCLGRALATYEGITISTAILQRFDVILSDDTRKYEPLAAMNMVRKKENPYFPSSN